MLEIFFDPAQTCFGGARDLIYLFSRLVLKRTRLFRANLACSIVLTVPDTNLRSVQDVFFNFCSIFILNVLKIVFDCAQTCFDGA